MTHPTYEMQRWIEQNVRPDVYAVVTLKQGLMTQQGSLKSWTRGDRNIYERAALGVLKRLDRRIFKKAAKRFEKFIPSAVTIEGDGENVRFHLNFLMQKPSWMPISDFETAFRVEWEKTDWAEDRATIEDRNGNCVGYSLKEGCKALLAQATRF